VYRFAALFRREQADGTHSARGSNTVVFNGRAHVSAEPCWSPASLPTSRSR